MMSNRLTTSLNFMVFLCVFTFNYSKGNSEINLAELENLVSVGPQERYWVGGSGSWDDLNHWSKTSTVNTPTGALPDDNTTVIFNNGSGLSTGTTMTIPPGDWEAGDFLVQTSGNFDLIFDGSNGNFAAMNIYGDLTLQSTHDLSYNDPSLFHNFWRFAGTSQQNITTANHDPSSIEFFECKYDLQSIR